MCGINGITKNDHALLVRMNEVTRHRGPDGTAVWEGDGITLGHNRLAIIDLSAGGAQPMHDATGRYTIVFNGEIYNYRELRAELSECSFTTESDTEVLLNAYRKWGKDALKRLNGIFAFGIWDRDTKTLVLVRDQLGVKPLYYTIEGGVCAFASEVKALLETGCERKLHTGAFAHYMRLLYTPGTQTLFASVERLAPGHMLTWQGGKLTIEAYYHIPDAVPSVEKQRAHMREEVECMIDAAVKRQLVADVPVGIYLSGGIDSSIVTDSVMRQVGEASTFSIGFDLEKDEESAKFNADALLAEKTASHYGTRHYAYTLESKNIPELLEDLVWHMDEPVGNLTALAQRALATYARRDVTVVLGGDGGDELFGGYKRHSLAHKLRYYWMIPSPIRSLLPLRYRKANAESWTDRYLLFLAQKEPVMQSLLVTPDVYNRTYAYFHDTYFAHTTRNTFLDDMMRADLSSWLVDESLLRSDKMSMASGLEQRVPFLDPDVVSLARSIPAREKVTLSDTKKILKDAFRHRLPEYIFNQPKRGWIAPTAKWLRRSDVREYVTNVLSPSYYRETASLFHWQHIEQMYHDHREKKGYYLAPLWSVVMFQVWARRFKITIEQ